MNNDSFDDSSLPIELTYIDDNDSSTLAWWRSRKVVVQAVIVVE